MNNTIDADIVDITVSETIGGGERYVVFLANQEPIDGNLTIVDLTTSSCRWPTGDPRDLATFRYCGGVAHSGPYCERHARLAHLQRAA